MTNNFLLDWALMAVSLFNTILLLWLGLTVLLNAERRNWSIWVAGGGMLLASAFFISHSAILSNGLDNISRGADFWWHVGGVPVIALPFAWYVVVLDYTGVWKTKQQQASFIVTVAVAILLVGLDLFANPLPSFDQVARSDLSVTPSIGGLPLLIIIYPLYIMLCTGLSLAALRRPSPSERMMGDLARRRARPWLMVTSVVLLIVSLLVTWVMVWAIQTIRLSFESVILTIGAFDLVIETLIGFAIVCVGQAVVAYEVFTGKTLPRGGLLRQWRNGLILAAGYGALISWSFTLQLRPIYSLLLTAVLMTVFYGLFSWRSFAERERYINHLRPFVASQRLYDNLLERSETQADIATPFYALCSDVLGTRKAYLIPMGTLAPLVGPLSFPPGSGQPPPTTTALFSKFTSPQLMGLPLNPAEQDGLLWAVPLWSERGLIGVLLLGEKGDGGLYTQEEIEIARASGERLIDTQASAELARRLMGLQRQRLAESQLLDRRARRVIHDEVLPSLHAATLSLNNTDFGSLAKTSEVLSLLTDAHHQLSNLLREMPAAAAPEVTRLGLVGALRQAVNEDLSGAFDSVAWEIDSEAESQSRNLPPLTAEVIFYAAREAIRNAARYGRDHSSRPLRLSIRLNKAALVIEDDGVGLEAAPGMARGSGQGLVLHGTMMAVVGGSLAVDSAANEFTRVTLMLPQST
jgi:signal transduction histidine kinase